MANGSGTSLFYREVIDAIAKNPPHVEDLFVLRDLCLAVDAGNRLDASRRTRELSRLAGPEDPLHSISYELFHALMARMLLLGWFEEFDLILDWDQTWFSTKEQRAAGKWEGILDAVKTPSTTGLATAFVPQVLLLLDREEQWKRTLNGLEGALRHLEKVKLPPPSSKVGAPPVGPTFQETVLPQQLGEAVEHFFGVLQVLFQQTLELAIVRLQQDGRDVLAMRKLQEMQTRLSTLLTAHSKAPEERLDRGIRRRIRVTQVRYGRAGQHRFLDAFPRYESRSVVFTSLDRDDKDRPYVRGEQLESVSVQRTRQLGFYLEAYGHPADPAQTPGAFQRRRRALIDSKHGGRLALASDDDFIAFLSSFFADRLMELSSPQPNSPQPRREEAALVAWRETVEIWEASLGHLSTHSRLNLTEGPPNYLTHAFPRNLAGRVLHDCGVYAVRSAYTLLSLLDRINRAHQGIAGTVTSRWVRLPLHVGLLIETSGFGLVVQHNDHVFVIDNDLWAKTKTIWLAGKPTYDVDPADAAAADQKFDEDVATSAFSIDLDMPVASTPLLAVGEPATTQTVWTSYQQKVVPSQLFSPVVGAPSAPQYKFDTRYLEVSESERVWYNTHVRRFWNAECRRTWFRWSRTLADPALNGRPDDLKAAKAAYSSELETAIRTVEGSYVDEILPLKKALSCDLRADPKLLLPGIRIVASERLEAELPSVLTVRQHIEDIADPAFRFSKDFVPPFAKPEEEILEVP